MRQITENCEAIYIIEGIDHDGQIRQFGLPKNQIEAHLDRGSNVKLAQLFGIVDCGLILVKHIFHGLKRPLCDGEDMNADKLKLVFCWKPVFDYCWHESGRFDDAKLESREAPAERVFAVIVSPNQNRAKYPSVDFWIERWSWLRESKTLASAPTEWENRYDGELKIKR